VVPFCSAQNRRFAPLTGPFLLRRLHIYRNGEALSRCEIRLGGAFGKGITYSHGNSLSGNSINESMSVESGQQALYLKPMGMAMSGSQGKKSILSPEGAAEYYWEMFIQPLQHR